MVTLALLTSCILITDSAIDVKVGGGSASDGDTDTDSDADTDANTGVDADGDGFTVAQGDCDDGDPSVNPGVQEDCSTTADDNCNGDSNDVNAAGCSGFYADADGDGYGGATSECLCVATAEFSAGIDGDCDDGNASVNPAAAEVCNNGLDDNCDGGPGACVVESESLSDAVRYVGPAGFSAGYAVAGVGDVNADGFDDVVTGALSAAYLTLGGAAPASSVLDVGLSYSTSGHSSDSPLLVSAAGDVNQDGFDDFLVGAVYNDDGGSQAGAAYLVLGSGHPASASLSTTVEYSGAIYHRTGEHAGCAVSRAGDVNGDGYDDAVIGADIYVDSTATATGAAYIVLGSDAPVSAGLADALRYQGEASGDSAGVAVAGGGDVDGDGYDDVVVGAEYSADGAASPGAAYIVLGGPSPSSSTLSAAVRLVGDADGDAAGSAVGVVGDVNADGYDDVVVGAYLGGDSFAPDAGRAYLVLGSSVPVSGRLSSDAEFTGESGSDFAGTSVANAGDVNQDGFSDFIIGAWDNCDAGSGAGAAYLVMGSAAPASSGLSTVPEFSGEATADYAGFAVAGAGDVDRDGVPDLLVGAPYSDAAGSSSGAAYLILGVAL